MKILFLSPGDKMDYMCDATAIGMRQLFGNDFVDYPRIPHLYQDFGDSSQLYGKGFTMTKILGDDSGVDRGRIENKIQDRYFDLIVYGSVQRHNEFMTSSVNTHYRRTEVIFIDGEDWTNALYSLARHGLYFKRELPSPHPGVFPIHFAIPPSKIGTCGKLNKDRIYATVDPRDRSTYIFEDDHSYYADYHRSLFAITMKKGGWDCLRHYEIMANGCIPLFLDIDHCPETTCTNLPKTELKEALTLMDKPAQFWDSPEGHRVWLNLWRRIHLKFLRYSTTDALARYVIETQQREAALAA